MRPGDMMFTERAGLRAAALAALAFAACSGVREPTESRHDPGPSSGAPVVARAIDVGSDRVHVGWRPLPGGSVRVELAPEPDPAAPAVSVVQRPGPAGEAEVTGLAPGVDVFLRLSSGGPTALVHARTHAPSDWREGGLRSVSLVAPDVLRLAFMGGDGDAWEAGPWRLRRHDHRAITVRSVHRQSVPVGQPEYEVGFGAADDPSVVQVEHRIYLKLAEPVGGRDVLSVQGPAGLAVRVPISDRYLQTPAIQLNQVGMSPRAHRRWAYVSMWMGDGGPLSLSGFPERADVLRIPTDPRSPRTDAVAHPAIEPRAERDADAGTEVRQIDLSAVPASEDAVYRVRIPGVGVSYPTRVSQRAFFRAFYVAARGLFHQRWGGDLDPRFTDHPRPADHPHVFTSEQTDALHMLPEDTPRVGERDLRGGYHDAGDFDQRPSHTVVAQLLLRAYELHPRRFTDGQLTLPESGNGIPDLLDEALWGIAGWEQLQEDDGGVRAGVESHRHPWGIYLASDDPLPYWTFARDAGTTARAAGLFAQAARLLGPFDEARAAVLKDRAVRAYTYATQHGASDAFMLYASSELFRLTGEAQYRTDFERQWSSFGPDGPFSRFATERLELGEYAGPGRVMPDFLLGYLSAPGASPALRAKALQRITVEADQVADRVLDSRYAHRNARKHDEGIDWGRGTVMGLYIDPILARIALGGLSADQLQRYDDALSVSADYVLGANPLGMVFMTGLGTVSPQEPLHLDSLVAIAQGRPPVPGIPVYGPVMRLPGHPWYRHALTAFHPPFDQLPRMLRYADVRTFVVNNECTVWECQAPDVEHLAALVGDGMRPPEAWRPGHAHPAAVAP